MLNIMCTLVQASGCVEAGEAAGTVAAAAAVDLAEGLVLQAPTTCQWAADNPNHELAIQAFVFSKAFLQQTLLPSQTLLRHTGRDLTMIWGCGLVCLKGIAVS